MNDDAVPDQAPTVPANPLRARQRHRARSKKEQSSRWLARQALPAVIVEEVPLASATFPTAAASTETPPPVATWEDDTHEFFQVGDSISPTTHEAHAAEEPAREADALPVHRPRRGLAAIVIGAVALAGVLCFAAVLKPHAPAPAPATATPPVIAVVREPLVEAAPAPVAVEIPPPQPVGTEEVAPAVPPKALREKARILLTHRQIADAIATADEAAKAEPDDAEGWLLLGAAQLEAGRTADAKQSFRTCTHVAKTGPVGECRSFSR